MKLWGSMGVFVVLVLFIEIPLLRGSDSLFHFNQTLFEAAIGQIDISALKLWQNRGGFSQTLALGSSGPEVRLIQTSLATDPTLYPQGTVSGYLGPATQRALLRFQDQNNLDLTGIFDTATRGIFNTIYYHEICPVPTTPEPDLSLAHVTRAAGLPTSYIPENLTDISGVVPTQGIVCVQQSTADALFALVAAARSDGIFLKTCSGYRGPDVQGYLDAQYLSLEGTRSVNEVALPYHSEHQTGTAVDLTGSSVQFRCADDGFAETPEAAWLVQNAWKYGFNMSYPISQKDGSPNEYVYEPWHWRYVGIPIAARLQREGISYNEDISASTTPVTATSTPTIIYY